MPLNRQEMIRVTRIDERGNPMQFPQMAGIEPRFSHAAGTQQNNVDHKIFQRFDCLGLVLYRQLDAASGAYGI